MEDGLVPSVLYGDRNDGGKKNGCVNGRLNTKKWSSREIETTLTKRESENKVLLPALGLRQGGRGSARGDNVKKKEACFEGAA